MTKGFVFSSCRCSKQSERFIPCGCFQICSGNNNSFLLLYACEVIQHKQRCDFSACSGVGWNTFEVQYFLSSLRNTLLRSNWMPAFLKRPWSNTRSTLCVKLENKLENFEKLFLMIQSRCSIYSHFLKPLRWNIHKLWHQALTVMKTTAEDFENIVRSPHFLHLTHIN